MIERGAAAPGEFAFPRTMVGVDVRRDHRLDAHSVAARDVEIVSDLELRIDDRRAALAASTEDV